MRTWSRPRTRKSSLGRSPDPARSPGPRRSSRESATTLRVSPATGCPSHASRRGDCGRPARSDGPDSGLAGPARDRSLRRRISVFAHGRREAVVGVNVVRIFGHLWGISVPRYGLRKSRQIASVAREYGLTSKPRQANWALLDLGALVCTARNPRCGKCPLRAECAYPEGLSEERNLASRPLPLVP